MGGYKRSVIVNGWSRVVTYGQWIVIIGGQVWSVVGHKWSLVVNGWSLVVSYGHWLVTEWSLMVSELSQVVTYGQLVNGW